MLIVAVANTKGGSGKTTVSTHLAAAFAHQGLSTALADLDKQRCAARWVEARPLELPQIRVVDLPRDPTELHEELDRLVIDVPAGLNRERIEELVRVADLIVVPVMPSAFDEVGTVRFLERLSELKPIRRGRRLVATIGNRTDPRTRATARLDAFLATLQFPAIARIRDAVVYADAAATGATLFDLPPSRAGTSRADWDPLLAWIADADEA